MTIEPKKFMTTNEVANQLGLSVGTVQKMVEKGILDALITEGGHRRIYTESFKKYCTMKGITTQQENTNKCFCVVGENFYNQKGNIMIGQGISIRFISDIFQIVRIKERLDSIFWDAEHYDDDHGYHKFINILALDHEILVYNAQVLNSETIAAFSPKIRMLFHPISTPVIDAYLYGRMH